jgi:hypothetical protein
MKQIPFLPIAFALFLSTCLIPENYAQNLTRLVNPKQVKTISAIPIVGCYTDTVIIKKEGLVVGNGSFTIKRVDNQYVVTFSELANDGGLAHPDVVVRNLTVNELKRSIVFDLPLHSGIILRSVKGQVSRKGIKMSWDRNMAAEYGQPSPFMKREKCTL